MTALPSRRVTVLAVACVAAAAALLRLPMFVTVVLGVPSPKLLWYDESYAIFMAGRGFFEAVRLSGADTTPALFVALLSLWMKAAGTATAALASFPYLWSVAAVPVMYLLGHELGGRGAKGRTAGLLAALIVAADALHVSYATEVRTYSLLFFFAALSLLFLSRHERTRDRRDGLAWTLACLAGFYASYTFLLLFIPQAAFAAWGARRSRAERLALAGRALILAAGYLPQVLLYRRWSDLFPVPGAPASFFSRGFGHGGLVTFFTYFSSMGLGPAAFYPLTARALFATLAAGAAIAAALAFAARATWKEPRLRLMAACVFGGIALAMAGRFIFAPRYYLAFVAPAAALAACALASLRRPWAAAVPLIVALGVASLASNEVPAAEAYKYYAPDFAATLSAEAKPGDLALVDHYTEMLFRRYPPAGVETAMFFPKDGANVTDPAERLRWFDYDLMNEGDYATLEKLTAGRARVWTIDYFPQRTSLQDPAGLKRRWFDAHFRLAEEREFPPEAPDGAQRMLLLLYER
ncbi:MAG TPA: glycosyltransferase family 39 protein [Candidatus Binatia bacterium]|nr:glycosyltransferase family 39 protein [Candidatus Binatia bacterium]